MIDPGNPFLEEHDYAALVAALEESVRLGVEHEETHRFVFVPTQFVNELPREVTSVVRVTGLSTPKGETRPSFTVFTPGRDYDASLSRVVWRRTSDDPENPPRYPDPQTPTEVTYRFRDIPTGITDLGPGSVTGTLLRAVGHEVALLYHQMNEAYRRAFLDTAHGDALDNVVALLGVSRNPAQKASGSVLFKRRQRGARVVVAVGTAVEDAAGRRYVTTGEAVLDTDELTGAATVEALEAGPAGNVGADAATVMPSPPGGVDSVTNPLPIVGGQEAEPDAALRERARHALERAGNATMGALEFAVRDVDGVEDVAVIDHSVDPDVPIGEVRVRYSTAGSAKRQGEIDVAVARVVENTRSAGVLALPERARPVTISGEIFVLPAQANATAAAIQYGEVVTTAIRDLAIGEPLSLRKLGGLVYQIAGLADVAEAQLEFSRELARPDAPVTGPVPELLTVDRSEQVVPGDISALPITGIAAGAGAVNTVTVQLLGPDQQPVRFRQVTLQVLVEVKAILLATPTLPPVLVVAVTKDLHFAGEDTATVTLSAADLEGYDKDKHDPNATARIALAGYDAVGPVTVQMTVG